MRKFLSLAVMCSLALPAMAFGQVAAPKTEEDKTMGVEGEEAEVEQKVKSVTTEQEESTIVVPGEEGADDTVVKVYETKETTVVEEEKARPFVDNVDWMVMASAFYRVGGYIDDGVVAGQYNSLGYPYTNYNGFGLNFVGGDFQYTGEKFALRIDLRFGEGAALLTPISASGFGGVKQGYVSWMPGDKVTIDFGFFDTIFGGEVVDEWNNANYTRGALYFNRQPFNHMGIRSAFALTDKFGMTLMVTNGGVLGGTPIDNNETPTLGWQFSVANDSVGFYFGGQHGAGNDNDNKNWENFFDWVLTANAGIFTLIANGDYQTLPTAVTGGTSMAFAYGHSLQLIFDASDKVSIGLRGEHLSGNDEYQAFDAPFLATGTITLRYKPVEYLVLSLEGRGEWVSKEAPIYFSRSDIQNAGMDGPLPSRSHNYAAILGFTAYIGN